MITELTTVHLEGEQPALFAQIEREEQEAIQKAQAPFQQKRGDMVTAVLAGKGLLGAVQQTPNLAVRVDSDGIVLTPEHVPGLALEKAG